MAYGCCSAVFGALVRSWTRVSCIACAIAALAWPGAAMAQIESPVPGSAGVAASAKPEPRELTLRDALSLALQRNPELAAFGKERLAAEAAILQAGVLPNPVLEIAGDNLRNARKADAGDRTTSIQIGQLIELGGKRTARIRNAEAGRDLANWDYEAKRIEILSLVAQRFVDVLTAQRREMLAEEALALARQVSDAVAKRVQAGKVSPVEETKARLAQGSAEIELEQARREGMAARRTLGALWTSHDPRFEKAVGDLDRTLPLPSYEQLAERVRDNPELARWMSEIERRRAVVDGEKAKAIPDVTLTAGVTRFSQFDDRAYLVGISVPLPLFNSNHGGILEANRRLEKAADEQRAAESRVLTALSQAYQRLAAIDKEIVTLRSILLPGAQSAFDAATRGYQLGKFGFLDVLDAQRTLFQTRTQNLRALADYQRGVSEIERLLGGPLDMSQKNLNRQ